MPKIVAGKYHWPHTNIFQRIFGLKSCNLHCNRRKIYPYVACLWSSKRMWWFRWNMSPQFGKRNVSKKHQLFSKEIELSGWYILPLKTDPHAHYCKSFFFDNSDLQYGFRLVITLFDIFWYTWQFWSSIWVSGGHHSFWYFLSTYIWQFWSSKLGLGKWSIFVDIFDVFDNSDQQYGFWMAINMAKDDSSCYLHRDAFVAIFFLFSKLRIALCCDFSDHIFLLKAKTA